MPRLSATEAAGVDGAFETEPPTVMGTVVVPPKKELFTVALEADNLKL